MNLAYNIEEGKFLEKKEVPQIIFKTGISGSYTNEFTNLFMAFRLGHLIPKYLSKSLIKKYSQRYPENEYSNPINKKNKNLIKGLDEIVDFINSEFNDKKKFEEELFKQTLDIVYYLMYGEEMFSIFK